ncbi:hypothetical protein LVQ78_23705 [Buttiauxella sp. A2-C2_NF]|uniref:hypothetical protein n=1 Tax=Buttiauxella TaxID=82976 RepID=UPI001E2C2E14|nr:MULTISPECIES: hypothetical protein [Buttiauxella]MCE0828997.1 hypothetical protein [Buttiauxella ferragutiae]UNK63047.1 hypothetical protein MNO13_09065 [Buttiauxella ferragutiae]
MKKIKLMADYGCYPLWGTTPDDFGDIAPDLLPISTDLQESLQRWADRFEAILNIDDPASSGFKNELEEETFIKDGYVLAQRLRDELGSEYEIIYQ